MLFHVSGSNSRSGTLRQVDSRTTPERGNFILGLKRHCAVAAMEMLGDTPKYVYRVAVATGIRGWLITSDKTAWISN